MKKLLIATFFALPFLSIAQPNDDIVYFTDSDVSDSRFGLAANFNPVYTDLRIINNDVGLGGGGFNVSQDAAQGTFQFNYHLDLIFELSQSFDISLGFGRAFGGYTLESAEYAQAVNDTIPADVAVDVSMYTIPFKINFNSSLSDVFDLEVVPMVEFNLLDKYQASIMPEDGGQSFTQTFDQNLQRVNYSVGLGLGGTYWFYDNWGVFARAQIKYMLNQMVDLDDFPRETLINYGLNVGLRYNF